MATAQLIPVGEYLASTYRPDVDFVDGELEERNLGELDHSDLQTFFASYIRTHQQAWGVKVQMELRVQVRPDRFRVPDLCLLAASAPREQIVRTPPVLCIEILSPADTLHRMRERVRDFLDMGVREVWIVDPASRSILICAGNIMTEQREGALTLEGTPIHIPVSEIFATLDEAQ